MSLENWMDTRKVILLTEKRNQLFDQLPQTKKFHKKRAELYDTLSRMAHIKRGLVVTMPENWGIPAIA